jgi:hypothetical protein
MLTQGRALVAVVDVKLLNRKLRAIIMVLRAYSAIISTHEQCNNAVHSIHTRNSFNPDYCAAHASYIIAIQQFGVYEYMKRELLRRSEVADQRQLQVLAEEQQHHRQRLNTPNSSSSSSSSSSGSHIRLRKHREPLGFLLPSR